MVRWLIPLLLLGCQTPIQRVLPDPIKAEVAALSRVEARSEAEDQRLLTLLDLGLNRADEARLMLQQQPKRRQEEAILAWMARHPDWLVAVQRARRSSRDDGEPLKHRAVSALLSALNVEEITPAAQQDCAPLKGLLEAATWRPTIYRLAWAYAATLCPARAADVAALWRGRWPTHADAHYASALSALRAGEGEGVARLHLHRALARDPRHARALEALQDLDHPGASDDG